MNIVQNNNIDVVVEDVANPVEDVANPVEDMVVEDLNLEELHDMFKEAVDNVVDNVLEELDEITLSEDDLTYLRSLPQDKNVFASQFSGNDLKNICKRFNLGIYGRKAEMAARILKLLK